MVSVNNVVYFIFALARPASYLGNVPPLDLGLFFLDGVSLNGVVVENLVDTSRMKLANVQKRREHSDVSTPTEMPRNCTLRVYIDGSIVFFFFLSLSLSLFLSFELSRTSSARKVKGDTYVCRASSGTIRWRVSVNWSWMIEHSECFWKDRFSLSSAINRWWVFAIWRLR